MSYTRKNKNPSNMKTSFIGVEHWDLSKNLYENHLYGKWNQSFYKLPHLHHRQICWSRVDVLVTQLKRSRVDLSNK